MKRYQLGKFYVVKNIEFKIKLDDLALWCVR